MDSFTGCKTDVVFVLDDSSSIRQLDFQLVSKSFMFFCYYYS